jgi:hypothetical protein
MSSVSCACSNACYQSDPALERFPFLWNRNSLYFSSIDRISCGEPVSTSPENAPVALFFSTEADFRFAVAGALFIEGRQARPIKFR